MTDVLDLADWQIKDGDLVFDGGDISLITGSAVVAQDIASRLKKRGTIYQLIDVEAEDIPSIINTITLEIEEDRRVKPGTAEVEYYFSGENLIINYSAQLINGETIKGSTNA